MTCINHNRRRPLRWLLLVTASVFVAAGGSASQEPAQGTTPGKVKAETDPITQWQPMFDGKSMKGWREADYPGTHDIRISDGAIVLGRSYLTGVNWTGPFPKANYEIRFEAARMQGGDFFAALTFPVNNSFCTLINGGWGGMLVGLSSLDAKDASENETTQSWDFVKGRWYEFRVAVNSDRIRVWIDGKPLIDVNISDREVGLRPGDIELSKPLGFASYSTVGAIRKVEYRELPHVPVVKPQ
jgi:hypothetical protein